MSLTLTSDHLATIQAHAESTYPEECCGLLMGHLESNCDPAGRAGTKRILEIWKAKNAWDAELAKEMAPILYESIQSSPDPGGDRIKSDLINADQTSDSNRVSNRVRHYWIDPEETLRAMRYARDRDLKILGIYHSHPDHPAVPSEYDRVAAWSDYSYLIVSVQQGQAREIQNWSLGSDRRFYSEKIVIIA